MRRTTIPTWLVTASLSLIILLALLVAALHQGRDHHNCPEDAMTWMAGTEQERCITIDDWATDESMERLTRILKQR